MVKPWWQLCPSYAQDSDWSYKKKLAARKDILAKVTCRSRPLGHEITSKESCKVHVLQRWLPKGAIAPRCPWIIDFPPIFMGACPARSVRKDRCWTIFPQRMHMTITQGQRVFAELPRKDRQGKPRRTGRSNVWEVIAKSSCSEHRNRTEASCLWSLFRESFTPT